MLAPALNVNDLFDRIDQRLRQVSPHRRTGLVSVTVAMPQLIHLPFPVLSQEMVYWSCSKRQQVRIGLGQCFYAEASGQNRLARLERRFEPMRRTWFQTDPDETNLLPKAFIGFAFDPDSEPLGQWREFPNACLVVPAVLYQRQGATSAMTFTCRADELAQDADEVRRKWLSQALSFMAQINTHPVTDRGGELTRINETPSHDEWRSRVRQGLARIRQGRLDKVVLSRRVRFGAQRPLNAARLLDWLRQQVCCGVQFAYRTAHSTLVGVSPERLVTRRGDMVTCDAVAGTVPCDDGERNGWPANPSLVSRKTRQEQWLVVEAIERTLSPLCSSVKAPAVPAVLTSGNVRHLWSPIHGRLKPDVSLLQLAARLHPTPAVAGTPTSAALRWLQRNERSQRGWYTGALGWLAANGDGELAVILRCAVLRESVADLYAGAGIVAGSDPEAELAETEWKLQLMHEALAVV